MVAAVMLTVEPDVMLTVFRIRSADEVPTVPCVTTVPPLWVRMRKKAAVPVASADESEVMVLNVARAPGVSSAIPEKAVALQVNWARRTAEAIDASASAGTPLVLS